MPHLSEALNADLSGYTAVEPSHPVGPPPHNDMQPRITGITRCPLPPIYASNPDSLRQFYVGGQIPQTRILAPQ